VQKLRASSRVSKPTPILNFSGKIEKKMLSNDSLSQLPIFPRLKKPTPSCGNICTRIDRPIWRWKDVENNKKQNGVHNANIQEKKKYKSGSGGLKIV